MRNRTQQIVLWALAIIVIFAVATIFGWKVFYGYVVPQTNNIAVFSTLGLFAFAALAGIMVNFGPCSLAVLPAYMSFCLGLDENSRKGARLRPAAAEAMAGRQGFGGQANPVRNPISNGARLGAIASLGVIGFYLLLGLLFATAGTFLAAYSPQLKLVIAALILILGIMLLRGKPRSKTHFSRLLRGKSLAFNLLPRFTNFISKITYRKPKFLSLLGFGVVYGAGGLSCFLPVFLPLVFFPFIGGQFFESIASFAIFALFQAFFLIGATILVGYGKQTIFRRMIDKAETMKKIAGVILILTSVYMFGIFIFLGM